MKPELARSSNPNTAISAAHDKDEEYDTYHKVTFKHVCLLDFGSWIAEGPFNGAKKPARLRAPVWNASTNNGQGWRI